MEGSCPPLKVLSKYPSGTANNAPPLWRIRRARKQMQRVRKSVNHGQRSSRSFHNPPMTGRSLFNFVVPLLSGTMPREVSRDTRLHVFFSICSIFFLFFFRSLYLVVFLRSEGNLQIMIISLMVIVLSRHFVSSLEVSPFLFAR